MMSNVDLVDKRTWRLFWITPDQSL